MSVPPEYGDRLVGLLALVLVAAGALSLAPAAAAHPDGGANASGTEPVCSFDHPEWRDAQTVAGVEIQEEQVCRPDNPNLVAASVKGTNNVPMDVLMQSGLSRNAVVKRNDRDGDGDPDVIHVTVEIVGINEHGKPTYEIAPGVSPSFWAFAPKGRGMVNENSRAGRLVRMPSPPIRVEAGDTVKVTVENTHYFPHTIHFHGVDHEYEVDGQGNDGVPQTSEKPIEPGESRTYEFTPEQAGTMFYHCHVVPNVHVTMGLNGMFVVEEERPDNHVQTLNIGAGKVRHPSKGVSEDYTAEYDLHYQGVDEELHEIPQEYDDPRVVAKKMNREYDATERSPDYFLLNGKSFPYTVRESLLVVEPGERYRLRILNGGSHTLSLHTHGHKFNITATDGVHVPERRQIKRDVVTVSAAQRVDLALNTTEDGLNSYGPGVWFFHDHREQAVTNDGISPGGTVTMITYRGYMDGPVPETNSDLGRYFSEAYYEGNVSFWHHLDENLGAPPANTTDDGSGGDGGFLSLGAGTLGGVGGAALVGGLLAVGFAAGRAGREFAVVLIVVALALATIAVVPAPVAAQEDGGDHHEGEEGGHHGNGSDGMGGGMMMDMTMVENGTVVNENADTPPGECEEVRGTTSITVRAGEEYAEGGEMFGYSNDSFDLSPCTEVRVTFVNEDEVRHQWMIHGLPTDTYPMGMFNIEVNGPGRITASFVTPADGEFGLHCSLPQHEQMGMHATIDVADASSGPGTWSILAVLAVLAGGAVAIHRYRSPW